VWPRVLDALVLVKPATVVKWLSRRPGRPKTSAEIRALIRQMSRANPLGGAPLASTANCSSSASTSAKLLSAGTSLGALRLPPQLGAASCGTI
jgi:hypothetical protein